MQGKYTLLVLFYISIAAFTFAHGELDEQIEECTVQIKKSPDKVPLYLRRGQLYAKHGDLEEAKWDYQKARDLKRDLFITDLLMAQLFLENHEPKEALRFVNLFIFHQPYEADGYMVRAQAYQQLKKEEQAKEALEIALTHIENPLPKHYVLMANATLQADSSNVEESIEWLHKGQAHFGFDIVLKQKEVELWTHTHKYEQALKAVDDILVYFPRKETWLFQKGKICEKAGKTETALLYYDSAKDAIRQLPKRLQMTSRMLELEALIIERTQLLTQVDKP